MTSAFLVSWAEDGLKELLGRKRPTGLGSTGPGDRSLPTTPGLLVTAPSKALGSQSGPMGRVTLKAHRPFILSQTEERGFAPPFGAHRAWRRRHRRTQTVRVLDTALGCAPALPPHLWTHNARMHGSKAGLQHHQPQRAARRRGPACWASPRRGRSHGSLGCGRLGFTRTNTCRNASSARRPAQHRPRHATAAARPDTARRGWRPCTPELRRDVRSAQSTTARRGVALSPSSKTTRGPS
jgi:hypothetical protein